MLTTTTQIVYLLSPDSVQVSGKTAAGNFQNQIRFLELMGLVDKPSAISEPQSDDAHELPVLDKQFLEMLSKALSLTFTTLSTRSRASWTASTREITGHV